MKNALIVKSGRHRYAIPFRSIVFMEKDRRKIFVCTDREKIDFYGKFDEIMPHLDRRFINPHRSFILNMDRISAMDEHTIYMDDGTSVRFCRECLERVKRCYDKYAKTLANR